MRQTSQNILYMLTVAVAWSSSDDNTTRCVLPVVWMTSCLQGKGDTSKACNESDSPGCSTGAKSDVYDCLVERLQVANAII